MSDSDLASGSPRRALSTSVSGAELAIDFNQLEVSVEGSFAYKRRSAFK
jgi:hypothetical protein